VAKYSFSLFKLSYYKSPMPLGIFIMEIAWEKRKKNATTELSGNWFSPSFTQ
jgi:hypothetical protein